MEISLKQLNKNVYLYVTYSDHSKIDMPAFFVINLSYFSLVLFSSTMFPQKAGAPLIISLFLSVI